MTINLLERTDPAIAEVVFAKLKERLESILAANCGSRQVKVELSPLSLESEKRFGPEWDVGDEHESLFVRVRYRVSVPDIDGKQNVNWYSVGLRCLHWLTPQSISENKNGTFKASSKSESSDLIVPVSVGEVKVEPFHPKDEAISDLSKPCSWIIAFPLAIYLPRKLQTATEIGIIDVQINGPNERVTVSALDFKEEIESKETDANTNN